MKISKIYALICAIGIGSVAYVSYAEEPIDTLFIPERAILLGGDKSSIRDRNIIGILYNTEELRFNDPQAPRFLFIDREGKMALGIGGYVKGTMQYDFCGAIDYGADFTTYGIPVPVNPAQKNQFFANVSHSTIFLKMVGRQSELGYISAYIQTNFTGGNGSGYLKLKKAFLSVGNVTGGLAPSTFQDGAASVPTIDDEGPSGTVTASNVLIQYKVGIGKHVMLAVSAEMPAAAYTLGESTESIRQRCPDIPVYAQYSWAGGRSHIRLSGLFRQLSYRDMIKNENRFQTGWAIQLSGMSYLPANMTLFYQGAYGAGYQRYINDLAGTGLDLIPAREAGKMIAPGALAIVGGLKYQPMSNLFISSSYSQCRVYKQTYMSHDTYRYGQYIVANLFYSIIPDMQLGVEYLHGMRTNINNEHGTANRIMAMFKYSF